MNENLNLVEILKNCPKGLRLWSSVFGDVTFIRVDPQSDYPIKINSTARNSLRIKSFTIDGRYYDEFSNAECQLFPSRDQRDWSKFKVPISHLSLVWAWDTDSVAKTLAIYNAVYDAVYFGRKPPKLTMFENYEPYIGEYPQWAKDVINTLK